MEHRAELLENWTKARNLEPFNVSLEPTMIKIVKAETIGQPQLHLTFSDGTQGDYDFAPLLAKETVLTQPLKKPRNLQDPFHRVGRPVLEKRAGIQPRSPAPGTPGQRKTHPHATGRVAVRLLSASAPVKP